MLEWESNKRDWVEPGDLEEIIELEGEELVDSLVKYYSNFPIKGARLKKRLNQKELKKILNLQPKYDKQAKLINVIKRQIEDGMNPLLLKQTMMTLQEPYPENQEELVRAFTNIMKGNPPYNYLQMLPYVYQCFIDLEETSFDQLNELIIYMSEYGTTDLISALRVWRDATYRNQEAKSKYYYEKNH